MVSKRKQQAYVEHQMKMGRKRSSVFFDDDEAAFLKKLGRGSIGEGVRALINMAKAVNNMTTSEQDKS